MSFLFTLPLLAGLTCFPAAQPGDLQQSLDDTNLGKHWIYDDLPRGFADAKATGKPLLVLFR
jgi:hypothetical protein